MGKQAFLHLRNPLAKVNEQSIQISRRSFTTSEGNKDLSKFVPTRDYQSNFSSGSSLDPKSRTVSKYLTPTQPGKGEGIHPVHDPYIVTKANVPSKKVYSNTNDDIERRRHILEKYEKETIFFKKLLVQERIEAQRLVPHDSKENEKANSSIQGLQSIVNEGEWPWQAAFTRKPQVADAKSPIKATETPRESANIDFLAPQKSTKELPEKVHEVRFQPLSAATSMYFNDLSQFTFPLATWFSYFHPSHLPAVDNVYVRSFSDVIIDRVRASLAIAPGEDIHKENANDSRYEIFRKALSESLQTLNSIKDEATGEIYTKKEKLLEGFGRSSTDDAKASNSQADAFHGKINYTNFRKSYLTSLASQGTLTPTSHEAYLRNALSSFGLLRRAQSEDVELSTSMASNFVKSQLSNDWCKMVESFIQNGLATEGNYTEQVESLWTEYEKYFLINEMLRCALPVYMKVHIFPSLAIRTSREDQCLLEEADRSIETRSLFSMFLSDVQRQSAVFLDSRSTAAQWNAVVGEDQDTQIRNESAYARAVAYPYSIFHDHKHMRQTNTEMYAHQHTAYYMHMLLKANHCLRFVHLSPLRLYLNFEEEQHLKTLELKRRPWRYGEFRQLEADEYNADTQTQNLTENNVSNVSVGDTFSNHPEFFHAFLRSSCAVYDLVRFAQRLCFDQCVQKRYTESNAFEGESSRIDGIDTEIGKIDAMRAAFETFPFVPVVGAQGRAPHIMPTLSACYPVNAICDCLRSVSNYLRSLRVHETSTAGFSPLHQTIESLRPFDPKLGLRTDDQPDELRDAMRYIERDLPAEVDAFLGLLLRILDKSMTTAGGAGHVEQLQTAKSLQALLRSHSVTKQYFSKSYLDKVRSHSTDAGDQCTLWEHQETVSDVSGEDIVKQILLYFTLPATSPMDHIGHSSVMKGKKRGNLQAEALKRILESIPVVLHCDTILSAILKMWRDIDPSIVPYTSPLKSARGREKADVYGALPSRRKGAPEMTSGEGRKVMLQNLAVYAQSVLFQKQGVNNAQMRLRYLIRSLFIANAAMEFIPSESGPSHITGGIYGDHEAQGERTLHGGLADSFSLEETQKTSPPGLDRRDGHAWESGGVSSRASLNLPLSSPTISALCAHLVRHLPHESFSKSFFNYFVAPSIAFLRDFLVMEPILREKVYQEHPNWRSGGHSAVSVPIFENGESFGERLKFVLCEIQDVLRDLHRIEGDLIRQDAETEDAMSSTRPKESENRNATLFKVLLSSDYKHFFDDIRNTNSAKGDTEQSATRPYPLSRLREISLSYPESDTISSTLHDTLRNQPKLSRRFVPLVPEPFATTDEEPAQAHGITPAFSALTDFLIHSSIFEVSKKLISSAVFLFLRSTYVPNHLQALLAHAFTNRVGSLAEVFPNVSRDEGKVFQQAAQRAKNDLTDGGVYSQAKNGYLSADSAAPDIPHANPRRKHVIVAEVASHMSYLDYNVFKKFDIAGSVQRYTDIHNRNVSLRVRLADLQAPSHVDLSATPSSTESKTSRITAYPYKPLLSVHGIRRLRIVAGEKIGGKLLKFDLDKFEKYQDNYEYGVNVLSTLVADSKKSELGEVENASGEYIPTVEVKVRSKNKGLAGSGREKILESVIDWDRVETESASSYEKYVLKKTEKGAGAYVGPQATWWKLKSGK